MTVCIVDWKRIAEVAIQADQLHCYRRSMSATDTYLPTARTQVRRLKKRAAYDKATVHAILDAGLICHVGFVVDTQPIVIPTLYVRDDEIIYFHGSGASRMLDKAANGLDICLTVSLADGFVLARSAFHHSLNYRSVVAIGKARLV